MISKYILSLTFCEQVSSHFFCTELNCFNSFQTIQFRISTQFFFFVYTQLKNEKPFYFIQFNLFLFQMTHR